MKKALLLFLAISIVVSVSRAQTQTQAPAQPLAPTQPKPAPRTALHAVPPSSAYCLPVSAGFLESEAKASDEMKKCNRGDTIVVPARTPGAVARMCDFSKAIVALGENIVCSMVFPERASK
jgi:glucose/arabinose dehydrogenase